MGTARGDLQLLARKIATDAEPEMPANIAAQVRTRTGHVSAALRNRSNELEAEAGDLSLRALWAAITSAYKVRLGRQLTLHDLRTLASLARLGTVYQLTKLVRNLNVIVSWTKVAPSAAEGAQLTLTAEAFANWSKNFPIFSNSLLARATAKSVPADSRIALLLRNSKFFTKVGIVGNAALAGWSGYEAVEDYRHDRGGDKLAVDSTSALMSASITALLIAPCPATAIIACVAGLAWTGAEIYMHRNTIKHVAVTAVKKAIDIEIWKWKHLTLEGLAWHYRHEIAHVLNHGADLASTAAHKSEDLASSLYDGSRRLVHEGGNMANSAYHHGTHIAESAKKEGKQIIKTIILHPPEPWKWRPKWSPI